MNKAKITATLIELRGTRTQREVATAIGISKSTLGMYERGERIARDEIKIKLASYYGKNVEDIFFN